MTLPHSQRRNQFGLFALRSIVFALTVSLVFCQPFSYAQQISTLGLPKPGTMVDLSPAYVPVLIKGLRVHPDNPILFDFIVDTGNSGLSSGDQRLRIESEKLIKYFLATLTIPEDDMWVNLSPYEKDRIIPKELGQTELGRDMLAEDYVLKQLTASLIYPEKNLGKEFWNRVYSKAQALYGTSNIPVDTFNKVWIVPDKAAVFVRNNTAFVVESHLKVMLEEDYLSLAKHTAIQNPNRTKTNAIGNQVVREVILPELEKEVNKGKNFANLRQTFYSLILASWYKKNLKEALLNQVYANKSKISGVDLEDKTIKEQIYQAYLKAYKKGVFNYIKEDIDRATNEPLPRKYFSGGLEWHVNPAMITDQADQRVETTLAHGADGTFVDITAGVERETVGSVNHAMVTVPVQAIDKKEWVNELNRNQSKQVFPGLLAVELAKIFRSQEFPWIPVVNNTGDKEIVEGTGYTVEKNGNVEKLTIRFGDNPNPSAIKEIRTIGYTINTATNTATIEAPNEEMAKQVNDVLDRLLYENTELSDYGYDRRIALQRVLREIEEAENDGRAKVDHNYDTNVQNVFGFLENNYKTNLPGNLNKINVVLISDQSESFGVFLGKINEQGEANLYVQQSFIDRINNTENLPAGLNGVDRLTHRFIYALSNASHGEKKILEGEYLRSQFTDDKLKTMIGEDVPAEYDRLVKEQLIGGDEGNPEMAKDIAARLKEYFWEILVNEFNGEAYSPDNFYFRFNTGDREYDPNLLTDRREGGVISWAGAYNPPHWAHIEALYKTMATQKLSLGALRTHGIDERKQQATTSTQKDRFDIVNMLAAILPHVQASNMGRDNTTDGETEFSKTLLGLNRERPSVTTAGYGVGVDHMNITKNGKPDTVAKFRDLRSETAGSNIKGVAYFNLRTQMDLLDVQPDQEAEIQRLNAEGVFERLPGQTILGGSSTNIRRALGIGDKRYITLLPRNVYDYIMKHHDYRGKIIGLPLIMRNIAKGNSKPEDVQFLKNWIEITRKDGQKYTVEDITNMFQDQIEVKIDGKDVLENPISLGEVQSALAVADKAALAKAPNEVSSVIDQNLKGGIDFNANNMQLNVSGDEIKFQFNPAMVAQFESGDFSGVRPVIINIMPIQNMVTLLGIKENEETLAGV